MSKEDVIETEGVIVEAYNNGVYLGEIKNEQHKNNSRRRR